MKPKRDFVAEFREAYYEEFGEVISDGEALERLTRLTNLLRAITTENSPDPWEEDAGRPPLV